MSYFDFNNYINTSLQPKQSLDNWKDNIDYSSYDAGIEDKFRRNRDYVGLADYLSNFRFNDQNQQREYEEEITQLRRFGRQYNAMQSAANRPQSDALSFNRAFDDDLIDYLDNDNQYKKNYFDIIKNLGKYDLADISFQIDDEISKSKVLSYHDDQANIYRDKRLKELSDEYSKIESAVINVNFNNKHVSRGLWGFGPDWLSKDKDEDQFTRFLEDNGLSIGDVTSLIGENNIYREKDGRINLRINKSNLKAIKLLSDIQKWQSDGRDIEDVNYSSYDSEDKLLSKDSRRIYSDISRLSNLLDSSFKEEDDVKLNIGAKDQIFSSQVLPYMDERQMMALRALNRGEINKSQYDGIVDANNEGYTNLLRGIDLSKYKIYTDRYNKNDEGNTLREMDNNLERAGLQDYVLNALREKRLYFQAALVNGEYGCMITVEPYKEKNELVDRDSDSPNRSIRMFIPGLFTKSIQSAFDSSTQGKTVSEMNSMQQYGYQYDLSGGGSIRNLGNFGAIYHNPQTDSDEQISREDAQTLLHRSIITEDAARGIYNKMFNIDGTPRVGYDYMSDIKRVAVAGTNELYPDVENIQLDDVWFTSEEERLKKLANSNVLKDMKSIRALSLYSDIMNILNKRQNNTLR